MEILGITLLRHVVYTTYYASELIIQFGRCVPCSPVARPPRTLLSNTLATKAAAITREGPYCSVNGIIKWP